MVLPAPFGPTIPSRSPRSMRSREVAHDRRGRRRPWRSPSASTTSLPECSRLGRGHAAPCRAAPRCSRRSSRSACSCADAAHVALAPRGDAVAQPVVLARRSCGRACAGRAPPPRAPASRQASKRAKPRSRRRVMPRSSQTVACDRFSRKRRSWLMRTRAERSAAPVRARAIRSPAGRDGWSARRAAGCPAPARARARARRGGPRRRTAAPGSSSPVEAELLQQIAGAVADRRRGPSPASTKASVVAKPARSGSCGR